MMLVAQIAATIAVGMPFPGPAPVGRWFVAANRPLHVQSLGFVDYPGARSVWLVNEKGYVVRSFAPSVKAEEILAWRAGKSLPIGSTAPDPRDVIVPLPRMTAAKSWMDMVATCIRIGSRKREPRAAGERGLLVLFLSSYGPADHFYADRLSAIADTGAGFGIPTLALFSGKEESAAAVARFSIQSKISFACALDKGNAFADAFRATRTPEAFLLDKQYKLVYTGAIDDSTFGTDGKQTYLLSAIKSFGQSQPVALPETRVFGTPIDR